MSSTAPYKTVQQAAEMLATSPDVIRSLIRAGALPASDIAASPGKRRWCIATADLERFQVGCSGN